MDPIQKKQPILSCHGLNKVFSDGGRKVFAVKEASFAICPGEFVCLRGPSGSGKSTFLKLLGGIDEPSSGEIFFQDTAYSQLGNLGISALRRNHIGYVLQELALINYLTAVENVELPLLFSGESSLECRTRALKILQMVGMEDRAYHLPSRMSAGERQRTAIARALLGGPTVLIADEPSSSLDSDNTQQVVNILLNLCRNGVAVLVATHDDRILTHAHRIISILDGSFLQ